MSQRDYYQVLGLSKSAAADEIKKAYRKLAKQHHPDANPDDASAQQKFAEITEAYEVLSDTDKRQKYDQFGHNWSKVGAGAGGHNPFEGFGGAGSAGFDLNDILGGMFGGGGGSPFVGGNPFGGGGRRKPRPQKGQDIKAEIRVPFQVGAEGGEHELALTVGGQQQKLSVKIPAGIEDGGKRRLKGQGHPGRDGGPAGDVIVTIKISPHPWFRRDGNDLVLDVPVSPSEAVLGAKVDVPTLTEGSFVMTIPPGTSSGAKLRLRGKGVPDLKTGERGNQIVVIKIVVPKEVSDESAELYRQLQELDDTDPRGGLWS